MNNICDANETLLSINYLYEYVTSLSINSLGDEINASCFIRATLQTSLGRTCDLDFRETHLLSCQADS